MSVRVGQFGIVVALLAVAMAAQAGPKLYQGTLFVTDFGNTIVP